MNLRTPRVGWVVLVAGIAAAVRVQAAVKLPMDHDEPVTLAASMSYGEAWRAADLKAIGGVEENREHPGLVKAFYGLGMVGMDDTVSRLEHLAVGRGMSLVLGVAAVVLVAWIHPVAGLLMALHALHIKYSAQMYLETGAGLAGLAGMLFWFRGRLRGSWATWASAGCFGAAAAAKYVHALPVIVVLGDLVLLAARRGRRAWEPWVFGLVFLAFFWALNPQVWGDPLGATWASLSFHPAYAQQLEAAGLQRSPWAFWAHLGLPLAMRWHPGMGLLPLEPVVLIVGVWALVCGVNRGSVEARLLSAWFCLVACFLMVWPTRWPQHAMGALTPLLVAFGLELRERLDRRYRA
jgi:hypothetical protein